MAPLFVLHVATPIRSFLKESICANVLEVIGMLVLVLVFVLLLVVAKLYSL